MQDFFNQTLGFQKKATVSVLPDTLDIELNTSNSDKILTPVMRFSGIDFVRFILSETDLFALEQHLISIEQEYFIDSKKTILTAD